MADVVIARWPEEREDAVRLVDAGVAVLYLVNGDDEAPAPTTCLEDWVRLPGDDRDLNARIALLKQRSLVHFAAPIVDDSGHLRYRGRLVPLSAEQAALARALVTRFGEVVLDADLVADMRLVDGPESGTAAAIRQYMTQLRAIVRPLDLTLRRVRRRGYMLQSR